MGLLDRLTADLMGEGAAVSPQPPAPPPLPSYPQHFLSLRSRVLLVVANILDRDNVAYLSMYIASGITEANMKALRIEQGSVFDAIAQITLVKAHLGREARTVGDIMHVLELDRDDILTLIRGTTDFAGLPSKEAASVLRYIGGVTNRR